MDYLYAFCQFGIKGALLALHKEMALILTEEDNMIFFQNGLKDNHGSVWKHSFQKLRNIIETGRGLDCRERTARDDLKGKADGEDWREKIGGWWW